MGYILKATEKWLYNDGSDNGIIILSDGSLRKAGTAIVYDDLRVNPNALPQVGSNPPTYEVVANDGNTSIGYAMDFDGSSAYGTINYYSAMDTQNLTIAMWVKADTINSNELIDRNGSGGFECYMNSGAIKFAINGSNVVTTPNNVIVAGAKEFIIVTAKLEGANTRIKIYVNGSVQVEQVVNATLPASSTDGYIVGEWNSGGWNYDGIMDNLQTYNIILTDAQITELYNNGDGINTLPTGVVETTDLIMYFKDDLINQATLGNGYDFNNNGGVLVSGLVQSHGSFGVVALSFPPNIRTEVFFTAQFSHTYHEGGDVMPHPHWMYNNADGTDVVWGLEYLWINVM